MDKEAAARRNRRMLATLEPRTRTLAERLIEDCANLGVRLVVVQARRTFAEQAELYAMGRTAPGRVVTNAGPGHSWHNFGSAFDIAVIEGQDITWNSPGYKLAGETGKALGLVWGGELKGMKGDLGHFEYHPGITLAQARAGAVAEVRST